MASSSTSGNTPAPPPPTPSNQTNSIAFSGDADVALSRFLNQLLLNQTTPSLSSLSPRFAKKSPPPPPSSSHPPLLSFVEPRRNLFLSAASDIGFFHLSDHGIPSHIFSCAMKESQSLFHSKPTNNICSSLGFNHDDEDEEDNEDDDKSLVFDTYSTKFDAFSAISEYVKNLERVGLDVVDLILSTAGLNNPFKKGIVKPKCLMWVSSSSSSDATNISVIKEEEDEKGEMERAKYYPYVVSLQYETKASSVMGESGGWIAVDPCVDSLLVMLGDIAQVWSNGRFKKVRGIPQHNSTSSDDISISLLVTLPMDSTVSPLLSLSSNCCSKPNIDDGDIDEDAEHECGKKRFRAFSFEEYAWRVYHERFPFKDPLLRYKI